MDIKNYLKTKWAILKPILIVSGQTILALTKDAGISIWRFVKKTMLSLFNKIWTVIKKTYESIKTKVLVKELSWLENIGDWFWKKAEGLADKLYGAIEDLPDGEGDSVEENVVVEEELDVVETPEDEVIPE